MKGNERLTMKTTTRQTILTCLGILLLLPPTIGASGEPTNDAEAAAEKAAAATRAGRKLVVGYILRHHPSWA